MATEPVERDNPEVTEEERLYERVIGIANDSGELNSDEMDILEAKLRSDDADKAKAAIQAALDEERFKRKDWDKVLDNIEFITGTKISDLDRSKIIGEIDSPVYESVEELEKRGLDILHQKNQG